ncbi:MAG: ATP-binding cassette domain-containing protein, partial [Pseudomonadota bacterium]
QALVFQRPVLLRRTVAANLDFALKLQGRKDREQRDALLELAGLLDRADQQARALSGGEQQRLALVRALALQPDVLFLDEPTASLDPASVQRIETILLNAKNAGTKIILVTHDIGQARRLADDVVFIHDGRIVEQQSAEGFFAQPTSRAAAAYLSGSLVL